MFGLTLSDSHFSQSATQIIPPRLLHLLQISILYCAFLQITILFSTLNQITIFYMTFIQITIFDITFIQITILFSTFLHVTILYSTFLPSSFFSQLNPPIAPSSGPDLALTWLGPRPDPFQIWVLSGQCVLSTSMNVLICHRIGILRLLQRTETYILSVWTETQLNVN